MWSRGQPGRPASRKAEEGRPGGHSCYNSAASGNTIENAIFYWQLILPRHAGSAAADRAAERSVPASLPGSSARPHHIDAVWRLAD